MINVTSLNDLQQLGINTLTGEACRLGMRLLCDLSEEGAELVIEFLGLPYGTKLYDNWNSMVGTEPAVASIMLTRESLWGLGKFALLRSHDMVLQQSKHGALTALNRDDPHADELVERASSLEGWAIFRNPTRAVSASTRNTHEMTGRTV
jgi:hypothetical protein